MNVRNELRALMGIAFRDLAKLLRDKPRIMASLIFPVIFIGALGGSLQANWGDETGYNLMFFIFTGVFGQTMFQSTASGVISLVEDRVNDFSQELFVAPVSRYTILIGKILGETLVSLVQGAAIILFGLLIQVPIPLSVLVLWIPVAVIASFLGGSFGIIVMANLNSERTANQIFPFLPFPQFFLAGVFSPIKELPLPLLLLSRAMPMTYAVDLARNAYYFGKPEYSKVVLFHPLFDLAVIGAFFFVFISIGTTIFIRKETGEISENPLKKIFKRK